MFCKNNLNKIKYIHLPIHKLKKKILAIMSQNYLICKHCCKILFIKIVAKFYYCQIKKRYHILLKILWYVESIKVGYNLLWQITCFMTVSMHNASKSFLSALQIIVSIHMKLWPSVSSQLRSNSLFPVLFLQILFHLLSNLSENSEVWPIYLIVLVDYSPGGGKWTLNY